MNLELFPNFYVGTFLYLLELSCNDLLLVLFSTIQQRKVILQQGIHVKHISTSFIWQQVSACHIELHLIDKSVTVNEEDRREIDSQES